MGRLQIIVVAIVVGLDALDGFDLLSISFASPGIAQEWGIGKAALGIVLSMELAGMGIGSIFLGRLSDRFGRRLSILGCLALISISMLMVTTSKNVIELSIWRVITGLGIGGMLASINAVAAEFSNKKYRNLCISLMVAGYPIGGVLGGVVASNLLIDYDWRSVFYFGAVATVLFIPIVYFFVPESPQWLEYKQPPNALKSINETLSRMGHGTISALRNLSMDGGGKISSNIFSRAMIITTLLVTFVYFAHILTFYFAIKWTPKIVVDMGFTASTAGGVLVWTNVGGILGSLLFGYFATYLGLNRMLIFTLLLSTGAVVIFGQSSADIHHVSIVSAFVGLFTYAGVVGMYSLCAQTFSTQTRAFGTGIVIGFGRLGAVLSPILAGALFSQGLELSKVSIVMASGSLISVLPLIVISLRDKKNGAAH